MYNRRGYSHCVGALALVFLSIQSTLVLAQSSSSAAPAQQTQPGDSSQGHMDHDSQMAREASGTAWLPDNTPMYALHWQRGPWQFMAHENAFLQSLHEASERGDGQVGSINWIMGMAQRNAGRGRLMFRGMFSAEPWTIGGCGYPDLLASGEQCLGEKIHDRQHPHDLFMELAAEYDASVKGPVRIQLYGGPVGEPALGPVAYPHRISAMPNPLAPIGHHWLDSTHVSFGVVTAGLYGNTWKAESSLFNGREPDDKRTNFDFGALDSISGRLWFLPSASIALQVSAGRVKEAEAADGAGPRLDVNKVTASATYHRIRERSVWASTIAWGRNSESGEGTSAVLIESSYTVADRDAWFGRLEVAGKTPHDLDFTTPSENTLTLAKVQGGYTRYLAAVRGFKAGLGAEGSVGFVPAALRTVYGSRTNVGAGIFVTVRPALMTSASMGHPGAGASMIMVQTAFDSAKLSCTPPIDPKTAPSTVFDAKTYYFCSEQDRAEFMKDPKMSLSMMPPKQ
jgi:YHS domain-containing protein